jgi:hypothetical protein
MYLQNKKELHIEIQKVGCLYLSMLRMIELITGQEISVEDVNAIWEIAKTLKYLDKDLNMKNMDGVLTIARQQLQYNHSIYSIGLTQDDKTVFWQWTKKFPVSTKYKIETLKTFGKEGTHFVLCNLDDEIIFDSYNFHQYKSEHIGRYHLFCYE